MDAVGSDAVGVGICSTHDGVAHSCSLSLEARAECPTVSPPHKRPKDKRQVQKSMKYGVAPMPAWACLPVTPGVAEEDEDNPYI